VSLKRLSFTPNGNVRNPLHTLYRDATTHIIFEQVGFVAQLTSLVPKPCIKPTTFRGVFAFIVFSMRHKRVSVQCLCIDCFNHEGQKLAGSVRYTLPGVNGKSCGR
jgi:hypothetical protein